MRSGDTAVRSRLGVRSKLQACSLLTMKRRTVLGRVWDRQQDDATSGADTFVRGESPAQGQASLGDTRQPESSVAPASTQHGPSVHVVRNATDARGESVSSTASTLEFRRDPAEQSPGAFESAATRSRGESVRGDGDETRKRRESPGWR